MRSKLLVKFPHISQHLTITTPCHFSLSQAKLMLSTPSHTISLRYILIYSHLCLGLPTGLFPSGSPLKPQMHFCSPPYILLICSHCINPWLSHNTSTSKMVDSGCAMVWEGICQPVITEVQVQYQPSSCRILWRTKWQWDRFFVLCWISPISIKSPIVCTHSFNHHQYWISCYKQETHQVCMYKQYTIAEQTIHL